mgnify:CR=1 FL=1
MNNELLADIERFLAVSKMGEHRFGILAANNGRLVERLRAGRSGGKPARVWPETERAIRAFMVEKSREIFEGANQ